MSLIPPEPKDQRQRNQLIPPEPLNQQDTQRIQTLGSPLGRMGMDQQSMQENQVQQFQDAVQTERNKPDFSIGATARRALSTDQDIANEMIGREIQEVANLPRRPTKEERLDSVRQVDTVLEEPQFDPTSKMDKLKEELPDFASGAVESAQKLLFGDPKNRSMQRAFEQENIHVGGGATIREEGFLPFMGASDIENVTASKQRLLRRTDISEQRAEELAIAEYFAYQSTGGGMMPIDTPEAQAYAALEPTKQERNAIYRSRLARNLGGALDIAGVAPVGMVRKVGSATLTKQLKATKNSDEAFEVLKRAGIDDSIANTYAKSFAAMTEDAKVIEGINAMHKVMRTTSVGGGKPAAGAVRTAPTDDVPVAVYREADNTKIKQIRTLQKRRDKIQADLDRGRVPPRGEKEAQRQVHNLNKKMGEVADETGVAVLRNDDGDIIGTSMRQSGIHAAKEFETHPFRDTYGLAGGKSFTIDDAFVSADNLSTAQMQRTGQLGPLEQTGYYIRQAEDRMKTWGEQKATKVREMARNHGVDLNKADTDIQVTMALHGVTNKAIKEKGVEKAISDALRKANLSKDAIDQSVTPGFFRGLFGKDTAVVRALKNGIPQNVENMVNGPMRKHLDGLLDEVNKVRKSLGKPPIKKMDNYAPVLQRTNQWSKARADKKTDVSGNFDYMVPNARKNPHAQPREAKAADLEFKASDLLKRYHESIARDMYDAPVIEQLKAINKVLKNRGDTPHLSNLIDQHIKESRVGMPAAMDEYFGLTSDSKAFTALNKVAIARNVQALAGNLMWIAFLMPASGVMTTARAGPLNMIKGLIDFAFWTKADNQQIRNLPTMITKSKGGSIAETGAGDIERMGANIVKGRLQTYNDHIGKFADAMEYWLTGSAAAAGRQKAKQIGLKGKNIDMYADWMAGATQSRYTRAARPMISNNVLLRANFPFSVYQFEIYRYMKSLAGMPGGRNLSYSERASEGIMLLSGMYLYNQYMEATTGRKITSLSTFMPYTGNLVQNVLNKGAIQLGLMEDEDSISSKVLSEFGFEDDDPDAPMPGAMINDIYRFGKAWDHWVRDNNIQPLRQEMIKWGMGFGKVAGAAQVNRMIDGLIANATGFQESPGGDRLFRVEGIDKYISPIMGPYSTRAGIEFFREGNWDSIIVQDARKEMKRLDELPAEEAAEELDNIRRHNPALADNINTLKQNERHPLLGKVREVSGVADRAQLIVDELDEIDDPEERTEQWDMLTHFNFGYNTEATRDKVGKKVVEIRERQEKVANGEIPDYKDGEIVSDKSIIQQARMLARSIYENPVETDYKTAFDLMFSGEFKRLRRIDNGALIVERDREWARDVRKERGAKDGMFLDHTVSFQLGGLDRDDNAILVSKNEWAAYTPVENLLGDHISEGELKRREAHDLIKGFKEGKISVTEIVEKYPPMENGSLNSFNKDFLEAVDRNKTPDQSYAQAFSAEIFRILDGQADYID